MEIFILNDYSNLKKKEKKIIRIKKVNPLLMV